MLSDEQIKVIRDSIDLSKIISRNVKLQKRGNNLIGLCPFHNEKTPSFNVNDEEGFYHCFGCGAHGDVISFIRNFEGKSFIEALETVADIAGLKIPSNNLKTGEFKILLPGRITPWKGQDLFIEALNILRNQFKKENFHAIILGSS